MSSNVRAIHHGPRLDPDDPDAEREPEDSPAAVEPLDVVRVADVAAAPVTWAWQQRIPFGKLTVIDGDPGLGKTAVLLDLVARWTRGESLPGEDRGRPRFSVVLLAAEDDVAETLRPRLEVVHADLGRVFVVRGLPTFPHDLPRLLATVRATEARAVILDPGLAFLDANLDAHADAEARRMVAGLAQVASEAHAAAVFVRHLNKTQGGNALYRGGGSIAIIATARSALLVAPDPQNAGRRILASSKSNLGARPASLLFRIVADGPEAPAHVQWEGETTVSAGDALAAQAGRGEVATKKAQAAALLLSLLSEGPRPSAEIAAAIRAAGIDTSARPLDSRSVRGAKRQLRIASVRNGLTEWLWSLPAILPPDEDGQSSLEE
jgi:putative DNA primase/helicase